MEGFRLQLVHRIRRPAILRLETRRLRLDDIRIRPRQGSLYDGILGRKCDVVQSSEGGGGLILTTSGRRQILPLERDGEPGDDICGDGRGAANILTGKRSRQRGISLCNKIEQLPLLIICFTIMQYQMNCC